MKVKALLEMFSSFLIRIVSTNKSPFALFISLLALTFVYRIQLTIGLFTNPVRPFDFSPACHPAWFTFAYAPYDLALVLLCFLLSWLLFRMQFFSNQSKTFPFLKISGFVFLHIFLIALLLVHGIHLRLLFDVQTGLDYSAIMEGFSSVSFTEIIKLVELNDYLFLLLPIGLFWLIFLFPLGLRVWTVRVSIAFILLPLSISVFESNYRSNNIPAEIRLNPALFLMSDIAENAFSKSPTLAGGINRINANKSSILHGKLLDADSMKRPKFPSQQEHPWNIVFFIMESVGTRYIFDESYGNPMPMPFLNRIAKEGWYLRKHLTASNVSTKAIFSLFSGLYDLFGKENLGTREDANVPSICNLLGKNYDSFLVTPSSLSWYFPTAFIKNSGISEIHSYENLKFKVREELHSLGRYIARDEIQTVDFLIQRMKKAKEPFMGIYISFAAHFPYFDYGEDYRIRKDDGRMISRYYNNLNLLDQMIKRIYDNLEEKGLLERTIFVIVGDHGQAFGQHHPNNFMHYRYTYNENLETPAIFYQPTLFKPRVFDVPTSHVDILPTLLDAIRIPHRSSLFNGESLFHNNLSRKYIFFYGYEGSISSLSTDLIKVQYSLKENRCWAYDLKIDPDEKNPLNCSTFRHQIEDLHNFVIDHDSNLIKYNAYISEEWVQAHRPNAHHYYNRVENHTDPSQGSMRRVSEIPQLAYFIW